VIEDLPLKAMIIAFFLLVAFPVHEFAHALTAYRLGDGTAKMFGKLTLNPIAHFHPIGGTMLVISVLLTGIPIGWAQTPVNPRNLQGRYGEAFVAAAGPLSNFVLAAAIALPLRLILASPEMRADIPLLLEQTLIFLVLGNIILAIFNLVPIPPLDGGAILLSVLSPRTAWQLRPLLTQYGIFILIALFFLPIAGGPSIGGRILFPVADAIFSILVG
jgi:Zn-dependent protease